MKGSIAPATKFPAAVTVIVCARCRGRMRTYYRPSEVAVRLGVCRSTVYDWIRKGVLPAFIEPATGTVRIPIAEFEKYLLERQAPADNSRPVCRADR